MTNPETTLDPKDPAARISAAFVDEAERATFLLHNFDSLKVKIALHELFGHDTGKLLTVKADGEANFDVENPPASPLTNKPVATWYTEDRIFNEVFGKMATARDECRADLLGAYLALEKPLLRIFGHIDNTSVTADDIIYDMYLHFGVLGLQALPDYDAAAKIWTQPHARARHAIMRVPLAAGNGELMRLDVDKATKCIMIYLERSKIMTLGKQAVSDLLLKLHNWRSTANIEVAQDYFGALKTLDDE